MLSEPQRIPSVAADGIDSTVFRFTEPGSGDERCKPMWREIFRCRRQLRRAGSLARALAEHGRRSGALRCSRRHSRARSLARDAAGRLDTGARSGWPESMKRPQSLLQPMPRRRRPAHAPARTRTLSHDWRRLNVGHRRCAGISPAAATVRFVVPSRHGIAALRCSQGMLSPADRQCPRSPAPETPLAAART